MLQIYFIQYTGRTPSIRSLYSVGTVLNTLTKDEPPNPRRPAKISGSGPNVPGRTGLGSEWEGGSRERWSGIGATTSIGLVSSTSACRYRRSRTRETDLMTSVGEGERTWDSDRLTTVLSQEYIHSKSR